jgi:hypothetical protein
MTISERPQNIQRDESEENLSAARTALELIDRQLKVLREGKHWTVNVRHNKVAERITVLECAALIVEAATVRYPVLPLGERLKKVIAIPASDGFR